MRIEANPFIKRPLVAKSKGRCPLRKVSFFTFIIQSRAISRTLYLYTVRIYNETKYIDRAFLIFNSKKYNYKFENFMYNSPTVK